MQPYMHVYVLAHSQIGVSKMQMRSTLYHYYYYYSHRYSSSTNTSRKEDRQNCVVLNTTIRYMGFADKFRIPSEKKYDAHD